MVMSLPPPPKLNVLMIMALCAVPQINVLMMMSLHALTQVYSAFGVDHEAFALGLSVSHVSPVYLDVALFSSSARGEKKYRMLTKKKHL